MSKGKIYLLFGTCISILLFVWIINYFALFQKVAEKTNIDPSPFNTSDRPVPYDLKIIADNLYVPWSITFTGKNRFLVSERSGNIRIVKNNVLVTTPLVHFDVSQESEEGLMGLATDPDYTSTKQIYACLATPENARLESKIISFTDNESEIGNIKTLLAGIPSAQNHTGCRLLFLPDKTLLITTGDSTDKNIAQDINSLGGKILRINRDGSTPPDNPDPTSPIWTIGHRNSQGLAYDSVTNNLWSTEHGPSIFDGPAGGDEINLIRKGQNYGWPIIHHEQTKEGLISPVLEFTPAVAPSGLMYYSGKLFPQFRGKLLFAALKGDGVFSLTLDKNNPSNISSYEKISDINIGRVREITIAPDGTIYLTTSNRDGRGKLRPNDDKIYQLVPKTSK